MHPMWWPQMILRSEIVLMHAQIGRTLMIPVVYVDIIL